MSTMNLNEYSLNETLSTEEYYLDITTERDSELTTFTRSIIHSSIYDQFKGKGREPDSLAVVELAVEFDPMQTKSVQKRRQSFHDQQYTDCETRKRPKDQEVQYRSKRSFS
jgi:DNA-directed RNA polymerase specialized sigma24 family protein